jgi:radical SAM superfamily enzyme YgiQ (UPF0313 family)
MRALVIDLNNFSRYPTLSVGYLTSVLRTNQIDVDILSPFAKGVAGYPRLTQARRRELYLNFLKHWTAVTPNKTLKRIRKIIQQIFHPGGSEDKKVILEYLDELLNNTPDVVLISAYTMYYDISYAIGEICQPRGIPVIIGGSAFVHPEVAALWHNIPGVSAVYAGEPEPHLISLINDLLAGKDISAYRGLYKPTQQMVDVAPPLVALDQLPFPDFSDFPWHAYPNKVIPLMTGRGCEWDIYTFCSDVSSASGRTFRSRSIENVIDEMRFQSAQFATELFVFLDLKLNSDLFLWRELIERIPKEFPNALWTASIHVDSRMDNGLSKADLQKAAKAGLVRITCGLESGSARMLKQMAKGIKLDRLSRFLQDAHEAGISVRMTAIIGYPGEEVADVELTTEFIAKHTPYIERIMLNRFTLMPKTPIAKQLANNSDKYPEFSIKQFDVNSATISHSNTKLSTRSYYWAAFRLMKAVHGINKKPLKPSAREFEGVM